MDSFLIHYQKLYSKNMVIKFPPPWVLLNNFIFRYLNDDIWIHRAITHGIYDWFGAWWIIRFIQLNCYDFDVKSALSIYPALAGFFRSRRIEYGYQLGPKGTATRNTWPLLRMDCRRLGHTPYNIWNSYWFGCNANRSINSFDQLPQDNDIYIK